MQLLLKYVVLTGMRGQRNPFCLTNLEGYQKVLTGRHKERLKKSVVVRTLCEG
jgi:hypothetical protein